MMKHHAHHDTASKPPTAKALLRQLNQVIYPHTSFEQALEDVIETIELAGTAKRPSSALVIGDSGLGKTSLAECIEAHFVTPAVIETEAAVSRSKPILLVEVLDPASLSSLAETMLGKLGDSNTAGLRTTAQKTQRVITLLNTCQVKAVLLDEVHNLLKKGGHKTKEEIRNWIKALMNNTGIPIILIGKPECRIILEEDDQLMTRYPTTVHFKPFRFDLSPQSEYRRILKAHAETIPKLTPVTELPDFSDPDFATRLFVCTGGRKISMFRLINRSVYDVLKRGESRLTVDDIIARGIKTKVAGKRMPTDSAFRGDMDKVSAYAKLLDEHNQQYEDELDDA